MLSNEKSFNSNFRTLSQSVRKYSQNYYFESIIFIFHNMSLQRMNSFQQKARILFSHDDDLKLKTLVEKFGHNWNLVSKEMIHKNPRQCKDRYLTYLSPEIKIGEWTTYEDSILIRKFKEFGNKWVLISKFLPGRTDTSIKNRYNTLKNRTDYFDFLFNSINQVVGSNENEIIENFHLSLSKENILSDIIDNQIEKPFIKPYNLFDPNSLSELTNMFLMDIFN